MKRILLCALLVIGLLNTKAQLKISQMPTYVGNPAPGWVPVVIGTTNRKVDASYFGYDKMDSVSISVDTLWAWKRGAKAFFKILPGATGNFQPYDPDLVSIAALNPVDNDIIQRKGGVWVNRTVTQYKTDLVLTKADVGLPLTDNTSDLNKPISTATQAALDLKANLASPTFTGTVSGITKAMVGLPNTDNTSDLNKPISTATQTALNGKQATLVSGTNVKTILSTSILGSGDFSQLASTTLPGFMSASDKMKLDSNYYLQNAPGTGSNLLRYYDVNTSYVRRLSITGGDTSASTPDILSLSIVYPVTSVFGRTGIVTAQSGDYSAFYPLTSRTISTTSPLAGGGDLSANRTFSINTNGITYSLMQQSTASKLLGNPNGTTANLSEIGLGYGMIFSGTNLLPDSSKWATKWALDAAVIAAGGGVTTVFGRSGSVVAATNDYTWAQINKATSSLADITTRSASDLSSGTLANARLTSDVVLKNAAIDLNAQTLTNFAANINAQTGTTYTLVAGDMGKVITISNAAAITLTVPSGLPVGFTCTVVQKGAGQITFTASGTTIVNKSSHTKTSGQYAVTSLVCDVSNNFYLGGDTSN